jgi:hypothetical protein
MIRVAKTLAVHLIFIFFFAFMYYNFSIFFDNKKPNKFKEYNSGTRMETLVDFFLFSTTIQAGVGISDISPVSVYGKMLVTIHHIIMITINVLTIHIFTR